LQIVYVFTQKNLSLSTEIKRGVVYKENPCGKTRKQEARPKNCMKQVPKAAK